MSRDFIDEYERAIVIENEDPEGYKRVKVRRGSLGNIEEWLPLFGMRPEIGEQVMIRYFGNDPNFPLAMAEHRSNFQIPPLPNSYLNNDEENEPRFIMGESGHCVIVDDTAGDEKVYMIMPDGKQYEISTSKDGSDIFVKTNDEIHGNMKLSAKGKIIIKNKETDIEISKGDSGGTIDVKLEGKSKKTKKKSKRFRLNNKTLH